MIWGVKNPIFGNTHIKIYVQFAIKIIDPLNLNIFVLQKPWKSKDYFLYGFSVKTIVLVRINDQQFKGTIFFMVFDFQGKDLTSSKVFQVAKLCFRLFLNMSHVFFNTQPTNLHHGGSLIVKNTSAKLAVQKSKEVTTHPWSTPQPIPYSPLVKVYIEVCSSSVC